MTMEDYGDAVDSRPREGRHRGSIHDADERNSAILSSGYGLDPYAVSSNRNQADLISTLLEQIRMLEARQVSNTTDPGPFDIGGMNPSLHEEFAIPPSQDRSGSGGGGPPGMVLPPPPVVNCVTIIPEVRKCTLADFKNRFGGDAKVHAVDVLISGILLQQEIEDELKLRQEVGFTFKRKVKGKGFKPSKTKGGGPEGPGGGGSGGGPQFPKLTANSVDRAVHNKQSEATWVQRIRIQSPAILAILSRAVNESWTGRPRTFFRPFSLIIYFHEKMREALRELEQRWGHVETGGSTSSTKDISSASATTPGPGHDEQQSQSGDRVDDSPEALREMRCYVKFMDDDIMPLMRQFDGCTAASQATVAFDDLWYLFRTGDLVFLPLTSESEKANVAAHATRQVTWRVYHIRPAQPRYRATPNDHRKYANPDEMDDDRKAFMLFCYHIDYTGDEFCVIRTVFKILPYDGKCLVRHLSVYPFRFVPNHERRLEEFAQVGRDFLRYINVKHSTYNWWTITHDPKGNVATDEDGNEIKHPEHVNSEVIVDFVEAFQTCPGWKPQPAIIKPKDPDPTTTADDFFIKCWADQDRSRLLSESTEIIQLRSGVSTWEGNRYITEDPFLCKVRENDKASCLTTAECLTEEDLVLLPIRVFAYVLQDRKFVQLNVQKLRPVRESLNAFECLKISPRYRQTIQALVEAHFMKKSAETEAGVEGMTQDLIQGKGKGLFILLHGVPGVGKTATAEAVAQANGKPLFSITCGDLGLTPKDVETALRGIFRLAHNWDCVLLLDEVDTFFSQRSKADVNITKNALVSVFLRVLEYYNGILFLTTNRPGALDEAFKSRIHLKLYYPPLTQTQTRDIWAMNIERLKAIEEQRCNSTGDQQQLLIYEDEIMDFAMHQFVTNPEGRGRWNGRQIRNAFQIAASLAYYAARKKQMQLRESHPDTPAVRPKLDVEHFQLMSNITGHFDEYMEKAVGMSDARLAAETGDRVDEFRFVDSTLGTIMVPPGAAAAADDGGYFFPSGGGGGGFSPEGAGGRRAPMYMGARAMPGYQTYGRGGMSAAPRYARPPPQRQPHVMDYDGDVACDDPRGSQVQFQGGGGPRPGLKSSQTYSSDQAASPLVERDGFYGNGGGHEVRPMGYTPAPNEQAGGQSTQAQHGDLTSPSSPPMKNGPGYFSRESQPSFASNQVPNNW